MALISLMEGGWRARENLKCTLNSFQERLHQAKRTSFKAFSCFHVFASGLEEFKPGAGWGRGVKLLAPSFPPPFFLLQTLIFILHQVQC